jgi:SMC interacting uncharacterized protein involved in chromosome segregation
MSQPMTKFDIHKAANELEDELQLKVANFTSHMNDEIDARDKRISQLEDDLDDANRLIEKLRFIKPASRPAWERDKDIQ